MSKIPKNVDTRPTNNSPFVISLGLGLLMLGLSWRLSAIIAIGTGLTWIISHYQKENKQQQDCLNNLFYQLIEKNQGYITALDLAMNSQLPGKVVQEFLDERAKEFGAELEITEQGGLLYYFPTSVSLVDGQRKQEVEIPTEPILGYDSQLVSEEILEKVSNSWTPPQYSRVNSNLKSNPENHQFKLTSKAVSLSLTQKELATRLNVHSSTISKRKTKPDFSQWSSQKDPESISWKYVKEQARFLPIVSNS
ncbi:MAG: hypothetical protein F6K40_34475 [Okeania sp. SIO3I5]|uniref:hypothetical protein n=1 Tax=Okeania sp. SIO3I5 TaxID=2607805 RepID=UPI0013B68ABD|nr:hypothetical protein [Okeania sp. SIO3I5]NEQ41045.1 hypothetical protein [Okeania sp. SIO3I5]